MINKILRFIKKRLIILIFLFGMLYLLFEPRFGGISLIKLHITQKQYEKKLWQTKAKIILLQHKIQLLETDNDFIEKYVREEMGMIKKGEKIIIKE